MSTVALRSSSAGRVELPGALLRKYPNAGRKWGWEWVFPATRLYVEPVTGQRRRHHKRGPAGVQSPADRRFQS